MNSSQCFTFILSPNSVWSCRKPFNAFSSQPNLRAVYRARTQIRACRQETQPAESKQAAPQTASGSTDAKPSISRTEEIAKLMGRSKESLQKSQDKVYKDARELKLKRYSFAAGAIFVGFAAFLVQKLDPNSGLNLLNFLITNSQPPSIIGTNERPTMVEFSARWCEECKLMSRKVFDLENKFDRKVNFVVIDVDQAGNEELVEKFKVDGVPQFSMLTKDGVLKGKLIGKLPQEILLTDLESLVKGEELPFPGLSMKFPMAPPS